MNLYKRKAPNKLLMIVYDNGLNKYYSLNERCKLKKTKSRVASQLLPKVLIAIVSTWNYIVSDWEPFESPTTMITW